ncbi:unnamed protein product, partial [Diamesa tonsa]
FNTNPFNVEWNKPFIIHKCIEDLIMQTKETQQFMKITKIPQELSFTIQPKRIRYMVTQGNSKLKLLFPYTHYNWVLQFFVSFIFSLYLPWE